MTPEKYYKEEFRNEEWIRYIDEHMKEELTDPTDGETDSGCVTGQNVCRAPAPRS